jgi:hypothetical protein
MDQKFQPRTGTVSRRGLLRLLLVAGVLLPFVDLPLSYYFGTLHPDYSQVRQFMSELAESGRPYAELVRAWFALASAVLAGFAMAVARLVPRSPAALAGKSLHLLWAGLGVASILFPCDPGCAGETFSGWMHRLIGEIMTVAILPVPALIWLGVCRDPNWRGFGWIGLPVQGLLVAVTLALAAAHWRINVGLDLHAASGLLQWLWWIVLYCWNVGLGLWLLREE